MIGIILAAGFSRRMGKNKLILPFKNNTIIESVIKETMASKLEEIYIVCQEGKVKDIGSKYSINIILNKRANEGQSTSIVEALRQIEDINKYDSFMFLMGDQPLINKDFLNEMINFYYDNKYSILVPVYNSKRGTPVIFSSTWREKLLDLKGDEGGRQIIKKYGEEVLEYKVDSESLGVDIDNLEDYNKVLNIDKATK